MHRFCERFIFDWRRAALLTLAVVQLASLAACGGGASSYGGGNTPVTGVGPSKLFAADSANRAIRSLANANPSAGTLVADRIIQGPVSTGLSFSINSLVLDSTLDYLYVGNGTSIRVFYGASMANGDIPPSRIITGIANSGSLFLDTAHDLLYVGDVTAGVRVFNIASTSTATASDRLISGDFGTIFQVHGVAADTTANNLLYVAYTNQGAGTDQVSVFNNATATSGSVAPLHTITPNPASSVGGLFLDVGANRLYVSSFFGGNSVMVFENASTLNGSITPDRTMTFPNPIIGVTVDTAHDRLYALSNNAAIYIVNGASTGSGAVTATPVLAVSGGGFTAVAVNPN